MKRHFSLLLGTPSSPSEQTILPLTGAESDGHLLSDTLPVKDMAINAHTNIQCYI